MIEYNKKHTHLFLRKLASVISLSPDVPLIHDSFLCQSPNYCVFQDSTSSINRLPVSQRLRLTSFYRRLISKWWNFTLNFSFQF